MRYIWGYCLVTTVFFWVPMLYYFTGTTVMTVAALCLAVTVQLTSNSKDFNYESISSDSQANN